MKTNTLMSANSDNWTYSLSGVTITTVPEPATSALAGVALLSLALLRRMRMLKRAE